ncbi:MAG: bifunctional methylenetetrahydrofolate dehydrogenase/methenyltetrahydrofolate cyclohydrolase FolD [Actinomycetota bacterium]|nr:bifunctional methylenetetrahydrofolate dehydrogenase/methenyltetrahydrofolate cyclohydrolase FolD [Actinomycetota bacterium]
MSARIIDGKAVSAQVRGEVAQDVKTFVAVHGTSPGLATVLVGDDPASHVYVGNKITACEEAGIRSIHHGLDAAVSETELLELVAELNADDRVDGILVQMPLPDGIDQDAVVAAIEPLKDVDGLTATSAGLLAQGRPGMVPCTPLGVMRLLSEAGFEVSGACAVVVGRSILVGRPMAALLTNASATVTVCHSRTRDLAAVCGQADILIAAVGSPRMIEGGWVKRGAAVIDVGINRTDSGLVGDVDFESAAERAGAITPVPGGVGPMTIAMLLRNTLTAAAASKRSAASRV